MEDYDKTITSKYDMMDAEQDKLDLYKIWISNHTKVPEGIIFDG